jgi:sugar (pentulose or hexulose) kinase
MRPHDVEVGQTYRVYVTRQDNPAQLLTGDAHDTEMTLLMFTWLYDAVNEFDLTVTAIGKSLGGQPAVTGVWVSETSRVSTPLPPEAAERLGLPANVSYIVEGVLKDAVTGQIVSRPSDHTLTVPCSWLRPL